MLRMFTQTQEGSTLFLGNTTLKRNPEVGSQKKNNHYKPQDRASQLFCSLPSAVSSAEMVYPWRRSGPQLSFWTRFLPESPTYFSSMHSDCSQPVKYEISTALLMREQVPSHSCRAIFQGAALTSDAWPTMRASTKILAALIPFLSSLVLIA